MLVSDEKRFVFVHVPKSGGTSVTEALGPWALPRHRSRPASWLRALGLPRDHRRYRFPKHAPLALVERRLPEELFRSFFKFAFVRNPWDRLVSDWTAVRADPTHRRHRRVAAVGFAQYVRELAPRWLPAQRELLLDRSGRVAVDFVGRFETLEQDFRKVCERIGVEAELPHRNRSRHRRYREFYDVGTREFVRERWGGDVEEFGYGF